MMYFASAIHTLYPQVTRTVGEEAFDIDGNQVFYDRAAVELYAAQMQAQQSRAAAFFSEADPLFFKYQAGEVTKDEWIAKRQEIRERFPYPINNQNGEDN
jgi:hypothetical protein